MNNELYKKAIDKWGQALQLVMVLEETAELQKEVCKIIRGDWSSPRMDSLAEEIADVELTLGQLKYMTGTESKVDVATAFKINRLERLLVEPVKEQVK
jgi:hypothetical protein